MQVAKGETKSWTPDQPKEVQKQNKNHISALRISIQKCPEKSIEIATWFIEGFFPDFWDILLHVWNVTIQDRMERPLPSCCKDYHGRSLSWLFTLFSGYKWHFVASIWLWYKVSVQDKKKPPPTKTEEKYSDTSKLPFARRKKKKDGESLGRLSLQHPNDRITIIFVDVYNITCDHFELIPVTEYPCKIPYVALQCIAQWEVIQKI